jgi:DNA topoisomerase VI subunit A
MGPPLQGTPSNSKSLESQVVAIAPCSSNQTSVRAEQQALAKWGLNFVIEEYLPRKLSQAQKFLP